MSMTKTGIIGLVVLIVILIGGYSIVTQKVGDGSLGEMNMGSSTDMTTNATSSETGANASTTEVTQNGQEDQNAGENQETNDQEENTEIAGTTEGNYGVGGLGDQVEPIKPITIETDVYFNEDWKLAFAYPETWDIQTHESEDGDQRVVTVGDDFAGGMKAEMTVTTYEDATIHLGEKELVLGKKYQIDLECEEADLDCAGGAFIIPVEGEITDNGFEGKVVKVSYGVFEMADYDGPDVHVSVDELLDEAQSVFSSAVDSITIDGVTGTASVLGSSST